MGQSGSHVTTSPALLDDVQKILVGENQKVVIKNFRGVKSLTGASQQSTFFRLIGKGDSSKSTILETIRYTFHPQWNLAFSDSDFYQCRVADPITVVPADSFARIDPTVGLKPDQRQISVCWNNDLDFRINFT